MKIFIKIIIIVYVAFLFFLLKIKSTFRKDTIDNIKKENKELDYIDFLLNKITKTKI